MSAEAFFDTSILVYAIARGDARHDISHKLLEAGGILSVQVLNELAAIARRKLNMSWTDVAKTLYAVRELCGPPVPITLDLHQAALQIAQRYQFHIYDSLIVAAALDARCTVLYSEDMQDGQAIQSVTVRNPFRAATRTT